MQICMFRRQSALPVLSASDLLLHVLSPSIICNLNIQVQDVEATVPSGDHDIAQAGGCQRPMHTTVTRRRRSNSESLSLITKPESGHSSRNRSIFRTVSMNCKFKFFSLPVTPSRTRIIHHLILGFRRVSGGRAGTGPAATLTRT